MKSLNNWFLFIGAVFIFISCAKDNSLAPDTRHDNQQSPDFKAGVMSFIGTSTPYGEAIGGDTIFLPNGKTLIKGVTVDWYDYSDDCDGMVTGISHWTINSLTEPDGITAKLWGKAEIEVDALYGTGLWKLTYHGYLTPNPDGSGFVIRADANGQGKEGIVEGMVGKWSYTMDYDFLDPSTFFYTSEGYIK